MDKALEILRGNLLEMCEECNTDAIANAKNREYVTALKQQIRDECYQEVILMIDKLIKKAL